MSYLVQERSQSNGGGSLALAYLFLTIYPYGIFFFMGFSVYALFGIFKDKSFLFIVLLYALYWFLDRRSPYNGASRYKRIRALIMPRTDLHLSHYFPVNIKKGTCSYPKRSVFGYHPHGLQPFAWLAMSGWPDKPYDLATAAFFHWWIPGWRELLMTAGCIDACSSACANALQENNSIIIAPGGIKETKYCLCPNPVRIILRDGFFRLALMHASALVPVLNFGELELFLVSKDVNPLLYLLQKASSRVFGLRMPTFKGGNMQVYPAKRAIDVYFGKAIMIPVNQKNPTQSQVDALRSVYEGQLREMYRRYRRSPYGEELIIQKLG